MELPGWSGRASTHNSVRRSPFGGDFGGTVRYRHPGSPTFRMVVIRICIAPCPNPPPVRRLGIEEWREFRSYQPKNGRGRRTTTKDEEDFRTMTQSSKPSQGPEREQ